MGEKKPHERYDDVHNIALAFHPTTVCRLFLARPFRPSGHSAHTHFI